MDTFIIQTQDNVLINFKYVIKMYVEDTEQTQTEYNEVVALVDESPNSQKVTLGKYRDLELAQSVLNNLRENIVIRRTGYYIIVSDILQS